MPEELTRADRERLAAVDKAVLDEAAAARQHELLLRKSNNNAQVEIEKIRAGVARDRRERRGYALAGLAVVTVILSIIAAIWTAVDRDRAVKVQMEQVRQQTAQRCIDAGNIWINNGCLITRRDGAPAPAASH